MSEIDMDELAGKIANLVKEHPAKCLVFNETDIQGIKEMAALFSDGKKKCLKVVWFIFFLGAGVLFSVGTLEFLERVRLGKFFIK